MLIESQGFSTKFFGPPNAATIRSNTSAAKPVLNTLSIFLWASCSSLASLVLTSIAVASACTTLCKRGSLCLPVKYLTVSYISIALPALVPKTWFISVIIACVLTPAPLATLTILSASALASARLFIIAPLPTLTSITNTSKPAASFLDKIEAVIKGIDSTVAVTSLIEYKRLSAGAKLSV